MRSQQVPRLASLLLIAVHATTSEVQARDAAVALHRHLADIAPNGLNMSLPAIESSSSKRAAASSGLGSNLQLLRRESATLAKTSEEGDTDKFKFMKVVSAGDVAAFCIDGDMIYALARETKYGDLLHGGIYQQSFTEMTPSTDWTLIGYGSMKSIAVRNGVMYGVGSITRHLYQQPLSDMRIANEWLLQGSAMKLVAICILEDTIYAVSEDDGKLYKSDFPWEDDPARGWEYISDGPGRIASFSVVVGPKVYAPAVYALFENGRVYFKIVKADQPQLEWGLRGDATFSSISVQGDSLYAVGRDHKICRQPFRVNDHWSKAFIGTWQSIAFHKNKIYALDLNGRLWSQILREDNLAIDWKPVTGAKDPHVTVKQILIQGDYIYAVAGDHLVYKQKMSSLSIEKESHWEQASKCCAKSIGAADGLIYGVGSDNKLYVQADTLMTIHSEWTLVAHGPIKAITFRGDTIYGVQESGHVYEQRMSTLTPTSTWAEGELLEDATPGPSGQYLMIFAHGDTMYAVGEDKTIYSKLLQFNITWPHGTHQQEHDTRFQALAHNLTDLNTPEPKKEVSTTEALQTTTGETTTVSLSRAATTSGWVSTSSSHEMELQATYTDYFNSPTGIKEEEETGKALPPPYRPPESDFPELQSHGTVFFPGRIPYLLLWLVTLSFVFVEVEL